MSIRAHSEPADDSGLLWLGIFVGPVAWLAHFQVSYSLVPWVCKNDGEVALHVVSLLCLLIAGVGGVLAWTRLRVAGARAPGAAGEALMARSRFMALLGLMSSVLFGLIILAQGLASFFISPCAQ